MNHLAGDNGFGRLDVIEDRLVGLKSRECYEQPAALALIVAHKALESLCLPGDVLAEKLDLEHVWAKQVYGGLWYSPLKDAIDAFFASTQKTLNGDVRLRLFKGNCFTTGMRSDTAVYDFGLATYDEGDTFDRSAAKGFMDLYGLPNYVWAKTNGPSSKKAE
jgi:argininosuccinate synthase